jgi:hypothetical protein
MQTYAYIWNMGEYDDQRAMRGRQGPTQTLLAKPIQQELARYQERTRCDAQSALEWFTRGMARHWAWNVAGVAGVKADGPFTAVAFK